MSLFLMKQVKSENYTKEIIPLEFLKDSTPGGLDYLFGDRN